MPKAQEIREKPDSWGCLPVGISHHEAKRAVNALWPANCRRKRVCASGLGMAERTLANPVSTPRPFAGGSAEAVSVNGASSTLGRLWIDYLQSLPPSQRHSLAEQARSQGYHIVTHPWPESVQRGTLTPAVWLWDEISAGFLEGMRSRIPPEPKPRETPSDLTELIAASPDLFLINCHRCDAPVLTEVQRWVGTWANEGWRVLVILPPTAVRHAGWAEWLKKEEVLTVVVADLKEGQLEEPWLRCTIPSRVKQIEEHLRAAQEQRQAERRAALAAAEERCRTAESWATRWPQLVALRQQLEELQQARHAAAGAVRRALLSEVREPFLEKPRRHLMAERDRHEAAYIELQTKLNQAEEHRHRCWLDTEKWRQQVEQQEQLLSQRQSLRPWHLRWWSTIFQGRARQRLDEFRTRWTEARTTLEQAAQAVSVAQQNLEIETQRHAAACEQIVADAVRQRQRELEAAIAEIRQRIDAEERSWSDLVASLEGGALVAAAPSLEQIEPLTDLARRRWHELREKLARQEAEESTSADWPRWLLERGASVAVVLHGLAESPLAGCDGLQFDLAVIADAHLCSEQTLRHWLALARIGVLVGEGDKTSAFSSAWSLLHAGQIQPRLRWLATSQEWRCVWCVPASHEQLHVEYLMTYPDVALHIMEADPAAEAPSLSAVVFPAGQYTLAQAKSILYDELGELTLAPGSARPYWRKVGDDWHWQFSQSEGTEVRAELEPGLCEVLAAVGDEEWRTVRLEFCLAHGWTWGKIWQWLIRHLPGAAFGRTASLAPKVEVDETPIS